MECIGSDFLDEIRNHVRVDEEFDNSKLNALAISAKIYLKNAGIYATEENELYKLAIMLMVGHWYENRNSVAIGVVTKKIEFSLESILTQLKYCYENEEEI